MKTSFIFLIVLGIFAAGCRPTLNVAEADTEQLEEKLIDYQKDDETGAQITLLLTGGGKISGELLSVRDSSITLCEQYSASEEELAIHKFSIKSVRIDTIVELGIEGNMDPLWIGAGVSLVAGTIAVLLIKDDDDETQKDDAFSRMFPEEFGTTCLIGSLVSLPALIGRMSSTEDMILSDIPPGYKFLPLKSLARYPEEEPDYLRSIE